MSSSNIKFGSVSRRSDEVVFTLVFQYIHGSIDLMSRACGIILFEALANSVELALFRESCSDTRSHCGKGQVGFVNLTSCRLSSEE